MTVLDTIRTALFGDNGLLLRNSPENPATSLSKPATWLTNLFTGGMASSGVSVNSDSAMGIPAVWRACRILGETIASLQLEVIEEDESGNRRRLPDHPIAAILREPSNLQTGVTWRESMQVNASLLGNGVSIIQRDSRTERPVQLRYIPASQVEAKVDGGLLFYIITNKDGKKITLFSQDVLHIPALALDEDGVMGKNPIQVLRESLGLSIATTQYGGKFFKNGAHIDGFLSTDNTLSPDAAARMAKSWRQRYSGIENAGSTPVLEQGLKYFPLSLSPQDALFVESSRLNVEDVSRMFGVPLHMLSSLERATFSNIEHQSIEFVTHTVRPWVKRWEAELNRKLFLESEKGRIYVRFNLDSLLRGNSESRAKLYSTYMQWGILNRDEIRRMEGWNDIPDGSGKTHFVPLNMVDPADENTQDDAE